MAINVQPPLVQADTGAAAEGLLLQVRGLRSGSDAGANRVSDVSFQVEPRELVVLTGPGRPAQSRLLQALAGVGPKPGGEVRIGGVDLYAYRKLFAPFIGFVPARPALHASLTVREILEYEARLRLPGRVDKTTRARRIEGILDALDLGGQAGRRFGTLNRFEAYRASIAVELVSAPGLLVLDAPQESLEPAEEIRLTGLLKAIARQGATILQSAQTFRSAQIADKVLLLDAAGALAWFGPADEALAYFHSFSPAASRVGGSLTYDGVLELLSAPCPDSTARLGSGGNPDGGDKTAGGEPPAGETWEKRFQASPAYTAYVDNPLNDKYPDLQRQDRPLARFRGAAREKTPPKKAPQPPALRTFSTLVGRAWRVLARERGGLWILLAPPLAALADFLISSPQMFDPLEGDPTRVPIALGLVIFMEMLVAALLFHNEIARERAIYQRERRTLALAGPYALSKVWIVLLAALYQGLVWAGIHFVASGMAGGPDSLPGVWLTLALVALAGGILGLIASSLSRSPHGAALIALALIVPQLIVSGSVLPMPRLNAPARALSAANPARYAFESLLTLSNYGRDIARDACWQIPAAMRDTLSEADKKKCICLGDNIFSQCSFPGIHKFFTFVIEQPPPAEPAAAGALSSLPAQPKPQPGESLDAYAQAVSAYAGQLEQYHSQVGAYAKDVQQYTRDLAAWQQRRSQVTGNAEGVIALALDQYGQGFQADLGQNWGVLLGISVILTILLVGIQPKKGYA